MWDTVGEFLAYPELPYTQHYTTPFADQNRNYWEQFISHFTRQIYSEIGGGVANGDGTPLVGHNAFLRWAALQKVAYSDKHCLSHQVKYWSECNVSEDFDMCIRLGNHGMFGRYVMYTGDDFQEGVSLSYMDEIIKFKKFAYGACEILFNPFKLWPTRGPFAPLLLLFVRNPHINWYSKFGMLSYVSSYLAMGAAFYFMLFEGVMSVLNPGFHDVFMIRGFDLMLTCTLIFGGVGTICHGVVFQWRREAANGKANILRIIWNRIKWVPATVIFFNSVLFPITMTCFMYFFSLKAVWGATAKETKNTSCIRALYETLSGYRYEYILYITLLGGYSFCIWYYDVGLYRGWAVMSYCVGHIMGPILLNPSITSLAY